VKLVKHGDPHLRAVQAIFFDADGRGFHGHVLDLLIGEAAQLTLQQHRIGRGHAG